MPRVPWTVLSSPVHGKTYLALISFLPLKQFRAIPAFIRYSIQTRRQLKSTRGVIGYSLLAKPFTRKFWTLSVWEDQQSLDNFVRQIPHSEIMQKMIPHMGKSEFAQWTVTASEIPLDWDTAISRLN
jgi:heme-degrading monooxygenase HmoA